MTDDEKITRLAMVTATIYAGEVHNQGYGLSDLDKCQVTALRIIDRASAHVFGDRSAAWRAASV